MHEYQVGATEQPAWVHVYVRRDGKWKLAAHGWQTPHSNQLAQQVQGRNVGAPVYVVRWDPVSGQLKDGLYTAPKVWVPRLDGMAGPGGVYRWSSVPTSDSEEQRVEKAHFLGFHNVRTWPADATLPDDWPAEDRDPSRWRMQAALPAVVPAVHIPGVLLWALTATEAPHAWIPARAAWLGGGGTYRLSVPGTRPVQQVRDNMASQMTVMRAWGPNDPLPPDWPADDRAPSRNRFQVSVPAGAAVIEVTPMRVWAWSMPSSAPLAAASAVGWSR